MYTPTPLWAFAYIKMFFIKSHFCYKNCLLNLCVDHNVVRKMLLEERRKKNIYKIFKIVDHGCLSMLVKVFQFCFISLKKLKTYKPVHVFL